MHRHRLRIGVVLMLYTAGLSAAAAETSSSPPKEKKEARRRSRTEHQRAARGRAGGRHGGYGDVPDARAHQRAHQHRPAHRKGKKPKKTRKKKEEEEECCYKCEKDERWSCKHDSCCANLLCSLFFTFLLCSLFSVFPPARVLLLNFLASSLPCPCFSLFLLSFPVSLFGRSWH